MGVRVRLGMRVRLGDEGEGEGESEGDPNPISSQRRLPARGSTVTDTLNSTVAATSHSF